MQHGLSEGPIFDIPCYLSDPAFRDGIRKILQQVRSRRAKDFRRLQELVREIRPYDDASEGDLGIWIADRVIQQDPSTWDYGFGDTPGVLKMVEILSLERLPEVLAHELGHAATRFEDLERRGPMSDEWRSESAADWYAYKWGFGRQIARYRKTRKWMHHGPPPGSTWEEQRDGRVYHYRLTRNFVAHLVKVTEGSL